MPNRAERRAAERAALKAIRNTPAQNRTVITQPVAAETTEPIIPPASDFTRTRISALSDRTVQLFLDDRKFRK